MEAEDTPQLQSLDQILQTPKKRVPNEHNEEKGGYTVLKLNKVNNNYKRHGSKLKDIMLMAKDPKGEIKWLPYDQLRKLDKNALLELYEDNIRFRHMDQEMDNSSSESVRGSEIMDDLSPQERSNLEEVLEEDWRKIDKRYAKLEAILDEFDYVNIESIKRVVQNKENYPILMDLEENIKRQLDSNKQKKDLPLHPDFIGQLAVCSSRPQKNRRGFSYDISYDLDSESIISNIGIIDCDQIFEQSGIDYSKSLTCFDKINFSQQQIQLQTKKYILAAEPREIQGIKLEEIPF